MLYNCSCGKKHKSRTTVLKHKSKSVQTDVHLDVPKGQNGQKGTDEDIKDVQKGQKGTDNELDRMLAVAKRELPAPKARKKDIIRPIKDEISTDEDEGIEEKGISSLWYLLLILPFAFIACLWYKLAGKREGQ